MSTRSTSYRYSQEFNNDDYNQMRAPNRIPDIVVGNFIHDDRESLFQAVDIFTNGQKFRIDFVRNNASGLNTAFEFLRGWRDVHDQRITVKLNTPITREYSAAITASRASTREATNVRPAGNSTAQVTVNTAASAVTITIGSQANDTRSRLYALGFGRSRLKN